MAGAAGEDVEWWQLLIEDQAHLAEDDSKAEDDSMVEDESMAEGDGDMASERDNVNVAMDDAGLETDHDTAADGESSVAKASGAVKNDKQLEPSRNARRERPGAATIEEALSERPTMESYRRDSTTTDNSSSEQSETEKPKTDSPKTAYPSTGEQELESDDGQFTNEGFSFPTSKNSKLVFLDSHRDRCDGNGKRLARKKFEFGPLFQAELCKYMVEFDYFDPKRGKATCRSTLHQFFMANNLDDDSKDLIARRFFRNEIDTCARKFTEQVILDEGFTIEDEEISGVQHSVLKYKRGYEYIGDLQNWDGKMRRQFMELPIMEQAVHLYTKEENHKLQSYLIKALAIKSPAISDDDPPLSSPSMRTPTSRLQSGGLQMGAEVGTLPTPSPTPGKKRRGSANGQGEEGGGKRRKLGRES